MTNEDFEKLKNKVENDPASRMVVPLADEYKKRGMMDEAVQVLVKTIEKVPDYPVARVALGKIYIDRGMLSEARDEFERVVKMTPNNFNAHKRLAVIYREQGEYEMAAEQYEIVLGLNPKDEEAATALEELRDTGTDRLEAGEGPASPAREGMDADTELSEKGRSGRETAEDADDDRIVISMPTATMADIFVSQGLYDKALNVYKELLSSDPANDKIIQRQKELKMLIKIKEERGGE